MLCGKLVAVVLPAFNAERTLLKTIDAVLKTGVVDHVILVDDASTDSTQNIARSVSSIRAFRHESNLGYGANQKSCYQIALKTPADIIVMIHPDYQYDPRLIPALAGMVASGVYDCVLGSRILCRTSDQKEMPTWRFLANRFLTTIQNMAFRQSLSEYHTGLRAFSRRCLEGIPFKAFSDDFAFDNEIIAHIVFNKFRIGEISCPASYGPGASSISFFHSIVYGFACLRVTWQVSASRLFKAAEYLRRLPTERIPDILPTAIELTTGVPTA